MQEWSDRRWRLIVGLVIGVVAVLVAVHWPVLPWFLDYFYHLAVVEGFLQSGGLVLHEWWEWAPEGRVHLYPPLWHLMNVPLRMIGIHPIVLARLWCIALFPLFACLLWQVTRRLFDDKTAAWMVMLAAVSFSLTTAILNYPAASVATLFALVAWLAIERQRALAASLALGLLGYSHTGVFLLFLLSLFLYAIFRKETRRTTVSSIAGGCLMASPWLIHQFMHSGAFHLAARKEQAFVEWAPQLFLLAGWGLFRLRAAPHPARFCLAWWLGTLPMAIHYRFRLLSGHGLIPTVLLAGLGGADLWRRGRACQIALIFILVAWPNNTVASLAGWQNKVGRASSQPLYFEKFWEPIAMGIKAATAPDELFACNLDYAAGLLTFLANRATTSGMLGEVSPNLQAKNSIEKAKLLVWIKEEPSRKPSLELQKTALQYHLQPLGETEIAHLLLNRAGNARRRVIPAAIPWWITLALLGLALTLLGWDLKRPR